VKVYRVRFDAQDWIVEARSFGHAIELWKAFGKAHWGDEWDGTEEPESAELLHDGEVIQEEPTGLIVDAAYTYAVVIKHPGRDWESDVRVDLIHSPHELSPAKVREWVQAKMLGPFQVLYVTQKVNLNRSEAPVAELAIDDDDDGGVW
jgi:hypothetical protein